MNILWRCCPLFFKAQTSTIGYFIKTYPFYDKTRELHDLATMCKPNPTTVTVLYCDTIVYRRGHRNLPARPSKMTGAAIETYRRGHRKLPARPSKPTGAAIENDRRGHRNRCVYRPSKMTGAAIETYRRGHRNLQARPSKMTGAAIKTYRRGHRNLPAGHFRWPRRSF